MPGKNGMGPMGRGPMTGRGMGNCTDTNEPMQNDTQNGMWRGRGRGYGGGQNGGRRRGFRRGFYTNNNSQEMAPGTYPTQPTNEPKDDVSDLQQKAEYLFDQLNQLKEQIEALFQQENKTEEPSK